MLTIAHTYLLLEYKSMSSAVSQNMYSAKNAAVHLKNDVCSEKEFISIITDSNNCSSAFDPIAAHECFVVCFLRDV